MIKGLLTGASMGALIGGVGVVVVSLATEQPAGNAPPATPQVAAPDSAEGPVVADASPATPQVGGDDATALTSAPLVVAPLAEPSAPVADTAPLALPETAAVEDVLAAPEPIALPDLAADTEAPVLPNPQSIAPQIPASEDDIVISTEPAAPFVVVEDVPVETPPPVETAEVAAAEDTAIVAQANDDVADAAADVVTAEAAVEVVTADVLASSVDPDDAAEGLAEAVTPTEVAEAVSAIEEPATEPVPAVDPILDAVQGADADVAVTAEVPTAPVAATPETVEVVSDSTDALVDTTDVAPETAEAAQAEPLDPAADETAVIASPEVVGAATDVTTTIVGTTQDETVVTQTEAPVVSETDDDLVSNPATSTPTAQSDAPAAAPVVVSIIDNAGQNSLPTGNSGVRVNRSLSNLTEPAAPQEPVAAAAPVDPNAPAIERYAAAFDNPEGKPLMALVLLDDGGPVFANRLAALPFAVTVALDPTAPDAAGRLASYRAAGIEVAMRAALPAGATPTDVEVAMAAALDVLPESALLLDTGEASDRAVTEQIIATLAEDGRGFVNVSTGLNAGLRTAEALGVPAASVFRELDAEDQDARVIGRFLDQAAFRARQGSGVILLGRVREPTLQALLNFGDSSRAEQVALAPASAVLLADD